MGGFKGRTSYCTISCCIVVVLQLRVHFQGQILGVVVVDLAYHADRGPALDLFRIRLPCLVEIGQSEQLEQQGCELSSRRLTVLPVVN